MRRQLGGDGGGCHIALVSGTEPAATSLVPLSSAVRRGYWQCLTASGKLACADAHEAKGFFGTWSFFSQREGKDVLENEFECLRTYQYIEYTGQRAEVIFRNFHQGQPGSGTVAAFQRQGDSLRETSFSRCLADPFYSSSMKRHPAEAAQGLPACLYWRSVPLSRSSFVRLPPMLPPGKLDSSVASLASAFPHWSELSIISAVWSFEAFFQDGDSRWSMGPLYSVQSLRLRSSFYIREYATTVEPAGHIDFAAQPRKEARGRLAARPEEWLAEGTWRGTMQEAVWDEDGDMLMLRPRPAVWCPPDPQREGFRLQLYPDRMYGYWPEVLPANDAAATPSFANDLRFEMGGMLREGEGAEFHRLVLRYTVAGHAESLTHERAIGAYDAGAEASA
ncbi:hypothetical protein WJX81_005876 [Elliptochloris bilobata]|uniref:Uncharacterized protein n=1 Tax=Elliptochloris bilobata TaxID=381761 RepID=A0AAW1S8D7_9CHLO